MRYVASKQQNLSLIFVLHFYRNRTKYEIHEREPILLKTNFMHHGMAMRIVINRIWIIYGEKISVNLQLLCQLYRPTGSTALTPMSRGNSIVLSLADAR